MTDNVSPRIVSEWYRCATVAPYPVQRRQIVEVDDGFQLTSFELLEQGPANLHGYDGGWYSPSKPLPTLALAEQRMADNGWAREVPPPGTKPFLRRRSGAGGGGHLVRQRNLRVPDDLWARFGQVAATRGQERNAVINRLVIDYVKRHEKK